MSILALVSNRTRAAIERKAAAHGLDVAFIESVSELTALVHADKRFSVAILPATLPDTGIWALWGQVRLLNPRPEILLYAPSVDFPTWSGVLEAGGHDVLVDPFSADEFYRAVMNAKNAFEKRLASGTADEVA
jgi:DNA-binding NtrC family response regulator